jgi:hypothetical protein
MLKITLLIWLCFICFELITNLIIDFIIKPIGHLIIYLKYSKIFENKKDVN